MFGESRSDLLYQDDFEGALIVTAAKIVVACDELGAPRPEYPVLGYGITLTLHALESAVIRDNIGTGSASNDALTDKTGSEEFRC